eukprot:CFRG5970T1
MSPLDYLAVAAVVGATLYSLWSYFLQSDKTLPDLQDKVVWITGASSGIGEALAYKCYTRGAKLILSSRNVAKLNEVRDNCLAMGECENRTTPVVYPLDLEKYEDMQAIGLKGIDIFGTVDVLVNNGGISVRARALKSDLSVDRRMIDVNFMGIRLLVSAVWQVQLTKGVAPTMMKNGTGIIIVTSSVQGFISMPERAMYAASKFALHGYFGSLRHEVSDFGVSISIICPGYVNTNLSMNALLFDGSAHGVVDPTTAKGYPPAFVAKNILYAIAQKKELVILADIKVWIAYFLTRLHPNLLFKITHKSDFKTKR